MSFLNDILPSLGLPGRWIIDHKSLLGTRTGRPGRVRLSLSPPAECYTTGLTREDHMRRVKILELLAIAVGTAIMGFGINAFNIANNLAEGV